MISHERVAENVYSFQSESYAQVTAGVVAGPNWAVVIDTLAYPDESRAIRDFVEQELKIPVRYVINTHYHADHTWGNCFFPGAMVIASKLCRNFLETRGIPSLEAARKQNQSAFRQVKIVLPHLIFEQGNIGLRVGKKTLSLIPLPGHSEDGIGVLLEEDRVLYSGDVFMPIPYIVDGNVDQMCSSLNSLVGMALENVIQGHGDIVLRGEIEGAVGANIEYLEKIRSIVDEAAELEFPLDYIEVVDIESCGKSRVLMGGLAESLHQRNMISLFTEKYGQAPIGSEEDFDDYTRE